MLFVVVVHLPDTVYHMTLFSCAAMEACKPVKEAMAANGCMFSHQEFQQLWDTVEKLPNAADISVAWRWRLKKASSSLCVRLRSDGALFALSRACLLILSTVTSVMTRGRRRVNAHHRENRRNPIQGRAAELPRPPPPHHIT